MCQVTQHAANNLFLHHFYDGGVHGIEYAKPIYMKIAIAQWQGRVSPVFDVSDRLCLIDIEGQNEVSRENVVLTMHDPFGRAKEVAGLGTNVLICGAISHVLERALSGAGVQVMGFLCGDLDTVIPAFLQGRLSDGRFFMPGCCGQRQRHRFRGLSERH